MGRSQESILASQHYLEASQAGINEGRIWSGKKSR
jgi:hypothetical protein